MTEREKKLRELVEDAYTSGYADGEEGYAFDLHRVGEKVKQILAILTQENK